MENGIGYDTWADKALGASPDSGRMVVDVGQVTGSPTAATRIAGIRRRDVEKVADTITAD